MKVAIVHDFLIKLGGAEKVLNVFSELFPDAPIYTLLYDEKKTGAVFPKERIRESFLAKYPAFIKKRHRILFHLMPRAVEQLDFSGYDLVISSSGAFSHGIITPVDTIHLCYCHSPMRYAWDYKNEYVSDNKLTGLKGMLWDYLIKKVRIWDDIAADRPDFYFANSETVQKRLKKYYHQESEVLYPPVEVANFKVQKSHSDYFVIVSTLTPYKNIELAVSLFNKTGKKLYIIGDGPQRQYLERIAGDNVKLLGFVDEKVKIEYLQNCKALIFPGEDDFGITPVEAMACGKPVLAYGKGGALETVLPGKTGELFYENNMMAIEDAFARMLLNYKFYDHDSIAKHAENFSREVFIKKFLKRVNVLTGK